MAEITDNTKDSLDEFLRIHGLSDHETAREHLISIVDLAVFFGRIEGIRQGEKG